jgi:hypothetical protein
MIKYEHTGIIRRNGTITIFVEFASINSKTSNSLSYVSHTSPILCGETQPKSSAVE